MEGNGSQHGVSACIIARNEERLIGDCLNSVRPFVNEVCVLDTGSSDRTVAIATGCGARVASFPWSDDFASARNAALALCKQPWILMIDADETFDPDSGPALSRILHGSSDHLAFLVARDDLAAQGGSRSVLLTRLFRNRPDIRYSYPVFEDIGPSLHRIGGEPAVPVPSPLRLIHRGYLPDVSGSQASVVPRRQRNLNLLRGWLSREPGSLYGRYQLTLALSNQPPIGERLLACEQAYQLARDVPASARGEHPYLPLLYAAYAETLGQQGAITRGYAVVNEGLALFPESTDLRFCRGELAWRAGDSAEARRLLGSCIGAPYSGTYGGDPQRRGGRPAALLSRLCLEEGNHEGAVSLLHVARQVDPGYLEARCALLRVAFLSGRQAEAVAALEQLYGEAPHAAETRVVAGEMAWLQGERPVALDLWRCGAGPCDAGNDARAQLSMGLLCEGKDADSFAQLPYLFPRDVPTAACQALLSVLLSREPEIDPALSRPALRRHLLFWLGELLRSGRKELLQRFMENARRYEDQLPGISDLVAP